MYADTVTAENHSQNKKEQKHWNSYPGADTAADKNAYKQNNGSDEQNIF
jgi:hypothetical protein